MMSGRNSGRRTSGQGALGRGVRVQIQVHNSDLASILCSPGGPWSPRLLGFSKRPGVVWKQLQAVGWGLALIIILGGFSQFIKTCAWRQAFTYDISQFSWPRSFVAQLISDAVGQFGVAGKVLGEGIRISLLGSSVPVSSGLSAGAIDGALHGFAAVVITVLAISATLLLGPLSASWRVYAVLLIAVLVSVVILAAVAVTNRWQLMGNAARVIGRLPRLQNWVGGKQSIIDSAEHNLLTFYREAPAAFWANLMLNVMWHALAVLEVYVILRFLGTRIAVGGAFLVEGLTKVINLVGVLNPGNFGTYEGGNMLIAKMFGVTSTAGLTLALCRRARTVFWAAVGALCMLVMKRGERTTENSDKAGSDTKQSFASPSAISRRAPSPSKNAATAWWRTTPLRFR